MRKTDSLINYRGNKERKQMSNSQNLLRARYNIYSRYVYAYLLILRTFE